jgi:hypothetical protein
LVNTSFDKRGPIVLHAKDASRCFMGNEEEKIGLVAQPLFREGKLALAPEGAMTLTEFDEG